jgi:hypothetical protein
MLGFDAIAKLPLATLPQADAVAGSATGLIGRALTFSFLLGKRALVR